MPINPIAMQVKPASTSGMLNTLAAIRQMQTAGQQQQINQLAIEKAQRDAAQSEAIRNALMTSDIGTPEGQRAVIAAGGTKGIDLASKFATMQSAKTQQQLNEEKLLKSVDERYRREASVVRTPDQMKSLINRMWGDPILGKTLGNFSSREEALADIPTDPAEFGKFRNLFVGGPQAVMEAMKNQQAQALAEKSQGAAMDRAQYQAQVGMARDIIKEATYVDPVSGQVVRNPQVSNEQLAAAEQFVKAFGGSGAAPGGQQMPTDLNAPVPGQQPSVVPPPVPVEGIPGTRTLEMRPTDQAVPTKLPTVPGQEATRTPLGQRGVLSQEDLPNARMMAIENKATAQKRADLKINHPQTKTGLSAVMSEAEKTVAAIDRILTDPALQNVTGNWDGSVMMEGLNGLFSQASRNVQSDINFLKSRAFLGGVSKGIPGLAPLSDAESQGLQASEANLDIGQDTKKMGDSLIDYKLGVIRTANNKVREYNETFKDLGIPNWKPAPLYIPREAADQLLATRRTKAHINEFNKEFGEGAAEQVLKGATNGR